MDTSTKDRAGPRSVVEQTEAELGGPGSLRPHAVVPRRPPGNVVSGLPLPVPGLAWSCPVAGRALALVAGAVEHVPSLLRREDPSTSRPAS